MTLGILILIVGSVAFILTLVIGFLYKLHKNWIITFLQNFTGVLFILSGYVKAIDPMGTAFKMEQYFAEFEHTFSSTLFSFIAPVFPWLTDYSIWFSVALIVFEMLLGIALLVGASPKFTSWAFLLLVVFFTVLTGFTFLNGFVPPDANFFAFKQWGPYDELQMKVTDCGCFGDFLRLEPRISFFKDLILLIPALLFVFRCRDMHQLISPGFRTGLISIAAVILTLYCIRNFAWNLPHTDFRPFKVGVNIGEQKALEEESLASVEITSWKLKNIESGKVVELSNDVYMKEFQSYPKSEWEVMDQIKTDPEIPKTKISDFIIYHQEGYDITEDLLGNPDYAFAIVCYKLPFMGTFTEQATLQDTLYRMDTIWTDDSYVLNRVMDEIRERQSSVERHNWNKRYLELFSDKIIRLANAAEQAGLSTYAIIGGADITAIHEFKEVVQADFPFYTADDILLKTIIRSNPGVLLLKQGAIIKKWHINKLPDFEVIENRYLQ